MSRRANAAPSRTTAIALVLAAMLAPAGASAQSSNTSRLRTDSSAAREKARLADDATADLRGDQGALGTDTGDAGGSADSDAATATSDADVSARAAGKAAKPVARHRVFGADEPLHRFDVLGNPVKQPAAPAAASAAPSKAKAALQKGGTARDKDARPLMDGLRRAVSAPGLNRPIGPAESIAADRLDRRLGVPAASRAAKTLDGEGGPFAPAGLRAGSFDLYTTLEQSLGYSSNVSKTVGGKAGAFSETALGARLVSDWSRHQAEINALAAYRRNFSGEVVDDPRVSIDGRLRLDINPDLTATLRGAFEYGREDPIEVNSAANLSQRPNVYAYSAGAEAEQRFGRTLLGVSTDVRRDSYANEPFFALDQSSDTYTAGLSAKYELSAALHPFIRGSVGRRIFDEGRDGSGTERDSLIEALKTGVEFDFGEKLNGEAAAGYAWNIPDGDGLDVTASPTLDARINWSPHRGTDVTLAAATSFQPDTADLSTSTVYEGSLTVRHRLTQRTELNGALSAAYRDSDLASERETLYSAEAGVTYWVNRSLALTGLLRHDQLDSKASGGDYTADSVQVGVKVQR